ncbi:MAG: AI-2E family transporter [Acidobacteria bacterium]|nr:AI-2E family transporter [Acidobacteriota bacterium]
MSERVPSNPLLALAALVVVAAGIKAAEQVMVPFLLAAFIATVAATPVFWLQRRRLPVGLAITVVVLALIAVLVGFGAIVAESADAFRARLPFYQERAVALLEPTLAFLGGLGIELSLELLDPGRALGFAGEALGSLGSVLTNGFFILLAVVFILTEAWSFPRKLGTVLSHPERDLPHFKRFAEKLNRYFAIKTTVSVATGVFVGLALWLLGVDFPILWGLLAFLLNYVPNIGSVIAAIPPVLLAIMQLGPVSALATAGVFLVVNVVMGSVVEPKFMGRELGLSTLVVFLSLVFWGWMLGPVGMLLSVPLTMTVKIAMEANPSTNWIAHLLDPADARPGTADDDEEPDDDGQAGSDP